MPGVEFVEEVQGFGVLAVTLLKKGSIMPVHVMNRVKEEHQHQCNTHRSSAIHTARPSNKDVGGRCIWFRSGNEAQSVQT